MVFEMFFFYQLIQCCIVCIQFQVPKVCKQEGLPVITVFVLSFYQSRKRNNGLMISHIQKKKEQNKKEDKNGENSEVWKP